jgi:transcriptional regulator with XRE-family HTH domain
MYGPCAYARCDARIAGGEVTGHSGADCGASVTTVQKWTGREARALREAVRMSVRDFASKLGVSARAVSKWEAKGESAVPRPDTQAMLDTQLAKASPDAQARFELMLRTGPSLRAFPREPPAAFLQSDKQEEQVAEEGGSGSGYPALIVHPIDGKAMVLVSAGPFLSGPNNQEAWLPDFYLDFYPTTNTDYASFVAATGRASPQHWTEGKFPEDRASHPVVNVTYRDAEAYARWTIKVLPSALEWEKAARGPRGNMFPWGNQDTPAKCNVRQAGVGKHDAR